ncbi:hypothetical protein HBI69_129330 [Parastagonospora nodorum]|nr:hypothetical protein HBI69_129330 [Parastagonospora nodorum]
MANKHAASESKDSFYRETFTFSEKELAPEPAADQQRVLIVGFFLTVDLKGDKKSGDKETKKLQKKHAGIVGLKLPAADMVYHLPTKYTGCEVASIEGLDPVDMTTSHALLVLFTCPGEGVFYLPEFRDFNKAAESRQRGWNKRVQKLVVKDDGGYGRRLRNNSRWLFCSACMTACASLLIGLFLSLLEIFWGKRQTEFKGPGVSLALEHLGLELGLSLAPKTWRWLFIVEGAVTAVVAIFGFFLLPNTPLTTSWLTPEERELAHARMERDRVGDSTECRDPRTWLFCFMQNFHLSACSFNSFFPTVVRTLGFNRTITLVLTCPPFLFAGAAGIFTGWSSGRMHERTWHITIGLLVAVVGFVIAASTLNTAGRYIACFIFPMGAYSVNSVIIGWASSTLSQTKEKKAVVLAMTNVGGQIGYIYGAYLWPETDKPRYGIGFGASAGFALCSIACAWVIRWMLIKENKKLRESTTEHVNLYGY